MRRKIFGIIVLLILIPVYGWFGLWKFYNIFFILFGSNTESDPFSYVKFREYLMPEALSLIGCILIIGFSIMKISDLVKTK